jgi:hypothetical protein
MRGIKFLALLTIVGCLSLTTITPKAQAQISINIGAPPNCPYGYYDYAPYSCAPYGYYGPEWFNGGAFIGAGRWFHGPANFRGHVNNRFDRNRGYRGPAPRVGERPVDHSHDRGGNNFRGNEVRDGRGHSFKR